MSQQHPDPSQDPPPPSIRVEQSSSEVAMNDSQITERSMSEPQSSEDLYILLRHNSHKNGVKEFFWSETKLRDTLSRERIMSRIARSVPRIKNIETFADKILKNHVKVYAILILIDKDKCFNELEAMGLDDASLPLVLIENGSNPLARASEPSQVLSCFSKWRPCKRDDFVRWQRYVNPPFLSMGLDSAVRHERFDRPTFLPFLEEKSVNSGGYGEVLKVNIPGDCHGFHGILGKILTNDYFALKRVHLSKDSDSKEDQAFWREVTALKRYSGLVHDHLVTLLMTWDYNNLHYLLFPWAETDLDRYWKQTAAPVNGVNPDIPATRWLANQIVGLAGAIYTIHNSQSSLHPNKKYGRHGDIKPENILWYKSQDDDKGILVLADLGLTTSNSTRSRSNIPGQGIPVTPGYRGPECDLQGGIISRSYDIWTFGCLLLEMCCWAMGGQQLREQFKISRTTPFINRVETDTFFVIEKSASSSGYVCGVKSEVSKCIAQLHGKPMCTEFFHDLLDLIESKMVIPPIAGMERIRSDELLRKLEAMRDKVDDITNSYCQYPCPKSREPTIPQKIDAKLNGEAMRIISSRNPRLSTYQGATVRSKTPQELATVDNAT
ncbi:unnamed protein product [Periconia digitata]|uniref:Protein kinase domain-containing protein n=1 Tax=Periconia digitata TaxID=1303443 RepID=A0A9W4U3N4_9PLEO|nr:unnamed protein product [Periconia digitata]